MEGGERKLEVNMPSASASLSRLMILWPRASDAALRCEEKLEVEMGLDLEAPPDLEIEWVNDEGGRPEAETSLRESAVARLYIELVGERLVVPETR